MQEFQDSKISWAVLQYIKHSEGGNIEEIFKTFSSKMDLLICNEVLYKDHHEDDLGLGGLRSLPGKPLILKFHLTLN